jgi:hypothetical protein
VRAMELSSEEAGKPVAVTTVAHRKSMANKGKSFFINGNYITKVNKNRSNEPFF